MGWKVLIENWKSLIGVTCIIVAIVGGGFRIMNLRIPKIGLYPRLLLGIFGVGLLIWGEYTPRNLVQHKSPAPISLAKPESPAEPPLSASDDCKTNAAALPAEVKFNYYIDNSIKSKADVPTSKPVNRVLTVFYEPADGTEGFVKLQLIQYGGDSQQITAIKAYSVSSLRSKNADPRVYEYEKRNGTIKEIAQTTPGNSPPRYSFLASPGDVAAVAAIYNHHLVSGQVVNSSFRADWTAVDVMDLASLGPLAYDFAIGSKLGTVSFDGADEYWTRDDVFVCVKHDLVPAHLDDLPDDFLKAFRAIAARASRDFTLQPYHSAFAELAAANGLDGDFWATDERRAQQHNVIYFTHWQE